MFVSVRIAQHFEYFQHVRLAQPFVAAPAHRGEFCVQRAIPAQFPAKGIVTCVHHGGKFFDGVKHSQNFRFGFNGFHYFLKKLWVVIQMI
jgi:hypothetical protein